MAHRVFCYISYRLFLHEYAARRDLSLHLSVKAHAPRLCCFRYAGGAQVEAELRSAEVLGRLQERCVALEEEVRHLEHELSPGANSRASHASEGRALTHELAMSLAAARLLEARAAGAEARANAVEFEAAELSRRVEDTAAGRARDRTEARAMAARMGLDAAALQAAVSRLFADLLAARRQAETSHEKAEARAGELAALHEAHAALAASAQRLAAEASGAKASF